MRIRCGNVSVFVHVWFSFLRLAHFWNITCNENSILFISLANQDNKLQVFATEVDESHEPQKYIGLPLKHLGPKSVLLIYTCRLSLCILITSSGREQSISLSNPIYVCMCLCISVSWQVYADVGVLCRIMTPYGNIAQGQHWLRYFF